MKFISLAAILALTSSVALAGFIDEEVQNPLATSASTSASGVSGVKVVGETGSARSIVNGFGRSIPALEAVTQIIPKGYSVRTIGISDSVKLDWQGGRDWVTVLSDAVETVPGLAVEVNQSEKVVSVKFNPTSGTTDSAATAPVVKEWHVLISDGLLSASLHRWGQDSGYQVIWDSPKDFPIMAEATFAGRFEDAISAIVESLASSQAPIRAVYYKNNVVRFVRFDGQTADLAR